MDELREDRRIRRTKKMLKQSLADLMQEKDFKDITVKDITDRADLNRGTFYLHYTDTYDLLEKVENETLLDFQAVIDRYRPKTNGKTLLPIIEPMTDYIVENADVCRTLFENKASNDFSLKFKQLVFINGTSLIKERFPNASSSTYEYFFGFITYGIIGLIRQWFDGGMKLPKKDFVLLADQVISAAAHAVLSSSGA